MDLREIPAHQNQGHAGRLVAYALNDIRAKAMKVVPACPFAARYVSENPAYRDLLR